MGPAMGLPVARASRRPSTKRAPENTRTQQIRAIGGRCSSTSSAGVCVTGFFTSGILDFDVTSLEDASVMTVSLCLLVRPMVVYNIIICWLILTRILFCCCESARSEELLRKVVWKKPIRTVQKSLGWPACAHVLGLGSLQHNNTLSALSVLENYIQLVEWIMKRISVFTYYCVIASIKEENTKLEDTMQLRTKIVQRLTLSVLVIVWSIFQLFLHVHLATNQGCIKTGFIL